ncbi:hypothetical protein Scep_021424 [Stephania cephalantha]|uniref:Uncharacterized protein n=1 Tax=Stephania cephalantha TaxID=152367 RepID=A0AAP0I1H0_9MAGN
MEGLIPLVYRAIVHYRNGAAATSRSAAYVRLPGDSDRFQSSPSETQLFHQPQLISTAHHHHQSSTLAFRSGSRRLVQLGGESRRRAKKVCCARDSSVGMFCFVREDMTAIIWPT